MRFKYLFLIVVLLWGCNSSNESSGNNTSTDDSPPFTGYESVPIVPDSIELPSGVVITWPTYGGTDSNYVADSLRDKLSLFALTGVTEKELTSDHSGDMPFGLQELEYDVLFNEHGILSITVNTVYMGAHPFYSTDYFNFDLESGKDLTIEDLITKEGEKELIEICDQRLQANVETAKKEAADIIKEDEMAAEFLEGYTFTERNLKSFCVTEEGINFFYYYDIPHVMKAIEPNPNIFVSWEEVDHLLNNPKQLGV